MRFSIFFTSSRDDLGLEENEPIKYNLHQINIFLSCGFYKYINYLKQSRHIWSTQFVSGYNSWRPYVLKYKPEIHRQNAIYFFHFIFTFISSSIFVIIDTRIYRPKRIKSYANAIKVLPPPDRNSFQTPLKRIVWFCKAPFDICGSLLKTLIYKHRLHRPGISGHS